MSSLSRRQWLQSGALATLALPFGAWTPNRPRPLAPFEPEAAEPIRLNANENPYGPSEKAKLAIVEALSRGNRYQHALRDRLKQAIAEREGLGSENVLLGAGSLEILYHLGTHLGRQKAQILSADLTYRALPRYVEHLGGTWQKVVLDGDQRFDLEGMERALRDPVDLVYLVNPNNPTGTTLPTDQLRDFCKKQSPRQHLLIDEAYIEYLPNGTQQSMARLVRDHPQLMVSRTFSKFYGLAGMRIGYLLAHASTIEVLRRYSTYELSVSASSLAAALASLEDTNFQDLTRTQTAAANAQFCAQLRKWGIPHTPSQTSFVLFAVDPFIQGGADLGDAFEAAGIVCRPFPRDQSQWCRMTMGREEEMAAVVEVLRGLRGGR